jgi:hypothetical protein
MAVLRIAMAQLAVVGLGVAFIDAGYLWGLPRNARTPSVLLVGLAMVAVASAWVANRALTKLRLRRWLGMMVAGACATVATLTTLEVSMIVIVNTVGS